MASLIWVGAILCVLASLSGTAGKQLLRYSELQRLQGTKASLLTAKISLGAGLAINVAVGPLIEMAAYAFAPQGIVAPLTGLDVVWNTLTAPCTLGERLSPTTVAGCVLIAGGAAATACVGSRQQEDFTPELLRTHLFRWDVLIYFVVLAVWLAFNILVLMPRSAAPKGEPFASGDKLRGLALGMTAGSIAGNMFCIKAFVECVQASIKDHAARYWQDWLPYVLLFGAIFFATSNLYFLTKAMREYEALFMGAIFEGSLIVAACISGSVVFSELEGMQWWAIFAYWLAVLGILVGITVVAFGCNMSARSSSCVAPTLKGEVASECASTGETSCSPSQDVTSPSDRNTDSERKESKQSRMSAKTSSSMQSVISKRSCCSQPFRGHPFTAVASWGAAPGQLQELVIVT